MGRGAVQGGCDSRLVTHAEQCMPLAVLRSQLNGTTAGGSTLVRVRGLCRIAVAMTATVAFVACTATGGDEDAGAADPETPSTAPSEIESTPVTEPEPPTVAELADVWERANDSAMSPDGANSFVDAVLAPTELGDSWLVAGAVRDGDQSLRAAAIWEVASPADADWSRTDLSRQDDTVEEYVLDIARISDTVVAAGGRNTGPEGRAAIWTRSAGGQWEPLDGPAFENDSEEWIYSLVTDETASRMIALGSAKNESGTTSVLWESEDGLTWNRIDGSTLEQSENARPDSMAVTADRIVAVGTALDGGLSFGQVWVADSQGWTTFKPENMIDDHDLYVNSVTSLGDLIVAVGSVWENDQFNPASWTSADGETWDGPFRNWEIDQGDRRVSVGFGASEVVVAGDRLLATSTNSFLQHVWTSTDGQSWTTLGRIYETDDNGVDIEALAGDRELTAVLTDDPGVLVFDGDWTSSKVGDEVLPRPGETPYVTEIAWTNDGFVAVGGSRSVDRQYEHHGESWVSADGTLWADYRRSPRTQFGDFNGISTTDGVAYTSVTETNQHASAIPFSRDNFGVGTVLRADESRWEPVYEFSQAQLRASIDDELVIGSTLLVTGWTFGDIQDFNPFIGEVAFEDPDAPYANRQLTTVEVLGGEQAATAVLCPGLEGTAIAAAASDPDNTDDYVILVAVRDAEGQWTRTNAADGSFTGGDAQEVNDCANGADGPLLAGWVRNGDNHDAAVWSQDNSGQWNLNPADSLAGNGDQWLVDILAVGDQYILAGFDESSGSRVATLWISDGSEWLPLPVGPEPWTLQSTVTLAASTGGDGADPDADPAETVVVLTAWQRGRPVMLHSTFGQLLDAAEQIAALDE